MDQVFDDAIIVERVAALDVVKSEVVCCVRVPGDTRHGADSARRQEVRSFATMTRSLTMLGDWLRDSVAGVQDDGPRRAQRLLQVLSAAQCRVVAGDVPRHQVRRGPSLQRCSQGAP